MPFVISTGAADRPRNGEISLEISRLRFASLEMTKGRLLRSKWQRRAYSPSAIERFFASSSMHPRKNRIDAPYASMMAKLTPFISNA